MEILRRSEIAIECANAVVLGRSDIVGKPMALLLMHANATVTICHSKTRDLRKSSVAPISSSPPSDVPRWSRPITSAPVPWSSTWASIASRMPRKPNASSRSFPERLDHFAQRAPPSWATFIPTSRTVAGALTPVPGGVGPLTIAMLMSNTVSAARLRRGSRVSTAARHCRTRVRSMLKVGLTGGIASGKSTVASILRDLDCMVLEMPTSSAHELLEPGQAAYDDVPREFGAGDSWSCGAVDRSKLGAIVFADAAKARAPEPDPPPAHPRCRSANGLRRSTGSADRRSPSSKLPARRNRFSQEASIA